MAQANAAGRTGDTAVPSILLAAVGDPWDTLRARVRELEARNAHLENVAETMSSWASRHVHDAAQRDRVYQEQIRILEQRLGECSPNCAVDTLSEISALGRRVVQSQLDETTRCLVQMEGLVKELECRELSALGAILHAHTHARTHARTHACTQVRSNGSRRSATRCEASIRPSSRRCASWNDGGIPRGNLLSHVATCCTVVRRIACGVTARRIHQRLP
jgi:uncharacterized coiled-coil protein SlyX